MGKSYHCNLSERKNSSFRCADERGLSKITVIFFATVIGVTAYVAYYVLPFYYYYYELVNQFEGAARVASEYTDQEIRQKLMYHIKKMGIPVEEEDLRISRYDDNRINISLDYVEVFYISWKEKDYTIREFPFHAEVDRPFIGPKTTDTP